MKTGLGTPLALSVGGVIGWFWIWIRDRVESWQQEQHHPGVAGLMQGIQGNSSEV